MSVRLIAAWPLERYQLWLAYADGTEGAVDLEDQLETGSLEPLRDLREFRRLRLDRGQNVLVWPGGILLDPATLYRELRQRRRRPRIGFL
ncbi:MAG: DUF2442 domain-containing protein [Gammaproteobacteria bacterium]